MKLWLACQDSNLEMGGPKPPALPFGYRPVDYFFSNNAVVPWIIPRRMSDTNLYPSFCSLEMFVMSFTTVLNGIYNPLVTTASFDLDANVPSTVNVNSTISTEIAFLTSSVISVFPFCRVCKNVIFHFPCTTANTPDDLDPNRMGLVCNIDNSRRKYLDPCNHH